MFIACVLCWCLWRFECIITCDQTIVKQIFNGKLISRPIFALIDLWVYPCRCLRVWVHRVSVCLRATCMRTDEHKKKEEKSFCPSFVLADSSAVLANCNKIKFICATTRHWRQLVQCKLESNQIHRHWFVRSMCLCIQTHYTGTAARTYSALGQ